MGGKTINYSNHFWMLWKHLVLKVIWFVCSFILNESNISVMPDSSNWWVWYSCLLWSPWSQLSKTTDVQLPVWVNPLSAVEIVLLCLKNWSTIPAPKQSQLRALKFSNKILKSISLVWLDFFLMQQTVHNLPVEAVNSGGETWE